MNWQELKKQFVYVLVGLLTLLGCLLMGGLLVLLFTFLFSFPFIGLILVILSGAIICGIAGRLICEVIHMADTESGN